MKNINTRHVTLGNAFKLNKLTDMTLSFRGDGNTFNVYLYSDKKFKIINKKYPKYSKVELQIFEKNSSFYIKDINGDFEALKLNENDYVYIESPTGDYCYVKDLSIGNLFSVFKNQEKIIAHKIKNNNQIYEKIYEFENNVMNKIESEHLKILWLIMRSRIHLQLQYLYNFTSNEIKLYLPDQFYFKTIETDKKIEYKEIDINENVIFTHNHFIKKNNEYLNTRMECFKEINNSSFIGFDLPPNVDNVVEFDQLILKNSSYTDIEINDNMLAEIKYIEESFIKHLALMLPLKYIFLEANKYFNAECQKYSNFFHTYPNIKTITYLAGYNRIPLVYIAKKNDIKCYEYQYSAIVKNHLAYKINFNSPKIIKPDVFLCWSKYWKDYYEIKNVITIDVGFDIVTNELINSGNNKKIVIISQPPLRKIIKQIIDYLTDNFSDYQIVLRIHRKDEQFYESKEILKDVIYSFSADESIGKCLGDCDFVIGSFSSALIEARRMNKKIALISNGMNGYLEFIKKDYKGIYTITGNSSLKRIMKKSLKKDGSTLLDLFEISKIDKLY